MFRKNTKGKKVSLAITGIICLALLAQPLAVAAQEPQEPIQVQQIGTASVDKATDVQPEEAEEVQPQVEPEEPESTDDVEPDMSDGKAEGQEPVSPPETDKSTSNAKEESVPEEANRKLEFSIEDGEGRMTIRSDGQPDVTVDSMDTANIQEMEYPIGAELSLTVQPEEGYRTSSFTILDAAGNEMKHVTEFPDAGHKDEVTVTKEMESIKVSFCAVDSKGEEEEMDKEGDGTREEEQDDQEGKPDTEVRQDTRTVTFRAKGSGTVALTGADDKEISVSNGSTRLDMPVGTYIKVMAEAEKDAYLSISVKNADEITLEPTTTAKVEEGVPYMREITVTDMDKVVDITFGEPLASGLRTGIMLAAARGNERQPEVGDSFNGVATVASVDGGGGHTVHSLTVGSMTGILSDLSSITLSCAQHSAAAPIPGMKYNYTYTVTSVNKASGTVTGSFYGVSQVDPATGATDAGGNLLGYQAISGTASIHRDYNGYAKVNKKSTNPAMTDGNSCYSLAGGVYTFYSNAACTSAVGTVTTDASGNTNTIELPIGTSWMKETKAPKGFALDRTVYKVTVNANQTTTVYCKDIPQSDPIGVLLGKIDWETNQNKPQGSASLAKAQFTVKYYTTLDETNLNSSTLKRSWVLETNENGWCYFSPEFKVGGDDFYYMSNGDVSIPLGTITIEETKAPEGYLINDEVFVRKITTEGYDELVYTYNEPEIKEEVVRGDFEIAKFGAHISETSGIKRPLEGVRFSITSDTTGDMMGTIVTDKDGFAHTKQLGVSDRGNLPYDTYTVSETYTPDGYDPVGDFKVTVREEGVTLRYILENTEIFAPIQVIKKDASTGKTVPRAGATFQMLDEDLNPIELTITHYPHVVKSDTFTTDENGSFVFPEAFDHGKYYLKEIKAPDGYLLNTELLEITVDSMHDWENPMVIEFFDENQMGKIRLKKVDSDTGEALSGAEFEVIAADDVVTPDGTKRYSKGDVVDTLVTDADGQAVTKEVYLGDYDVTETKSPPGYVVDTKPHRVTVAYGDQEIPVVMVDLGKIGNKPTKMIITKVKAGSDTPLPGVKFNVWRKGADSDDVDDMAVKEEYTTDNDGRITLRHLAPGTYCYQEIATLEGYLLDSKVYEFVVDESGRIDGKDTGEVKISNDFTKVEISKVDAATGEPVVGAELELIDLEGKTIAKWTTTDKPHYMEALTAGNYILNENYAPKGYLIAEEIRFTVKETGEIQKVVMEDEYSVGTIRTSIPKNFRGGWGMGHLVRTGDVANIAKLVWLLLASIAAIAGCVIYKKRKGMERDG